jgi:hypothetical protein
MGSELAAAVAAKKLHDTALALQHRYVDIQVHPVDALQLEGHMVIKNFCDTLRYAHFRLRFDSDP